ncbi:MAG: restriction endonuclease subunit S [Dethiobacteria bacterium]
MRSEWQEATLGEIVNFRRGHDLTRKNMNPEGRYPVVGSNGVIGFHDSYTLKGPLLTIGRSGNVGTPYFLEGAGWAHNTTLYVDDFKENEPRFIYYFLQTIPFAQYGGGSAVPTLNRNHIHPLKVIYPKKVSIQKAIAATLSCLDAKIEVNNKIIKNLEQQAQAIFKSWFVDFEPFQDGEFVESELGLIPKGWRAGSLGEIIKITSGKRPKARQERKDSLFRYPLFGASGIMGYTSAYLYNEKIITIGRVGTHGKVQEISEASWPSDNTLVIMPKHYGFVASVLKAIDYGALNRGSTQPLITQTDIKNTKIVVPATEILGKFEDMYKMYFNLSRTINTQNTTLSALRDTLLPKLMSGEIEVPVEQD